MFVKGFQKGTPALDSTGTFGLIQDTALERVYNITLGFVRISTFCSISLLVALTGIIGRIGLINTIITTIIFNIGFNLNYYLNYLIYFRGQAKTQLFIMDDFQGSRVLMFGAGFGLVLMLLYHKFIPILKNPTTQFTDILSSLFSMLGTCFILAFFYFLLDTYTAGDKSLALLNIYFAFSGSIVTSIAISCILAGVVTFHHINMTIIAGVVQISIIGTFIQTPYVSLLVGAFAGAVTSVLSHFLF